ncbi:hypothetical protein DRN74_01115 [Candidatus Micrarchaeota archaeon]|nr:MAG: hypothetical protein DRN74_01115 [Candidatus Micrarchaeota archaeon]
MSALVSTSMIEAILVIISMSPPLWGTNLPYTPSTLYQLEALAHSLDVPESYSSELVFYDFREASTEFKQSLSDVISKAIELKLHKRGSIYDIVKGVPVLNKGALTYEILQYADMFTELRSGLENLMAVARIELIKDMEKLDSLGADLPSYSGFASATYERIYDILHNSEYCNYDCSKASADERIFIACYLCKSTDANEPIAKRFNDLAGYNTDSIAKKVYNLHVAALNSEQDMKDEYYILKHNVKLYLDKFKKEKTAESLGLNYLDEETVSDIGNYVDLSEFHSNYSCNPPIDEIKSRLSDGITDLDFTYNNIEKRFPKNSDDYLANRIIVLRRSLSDLKQLESCYNSSVDYLSFIKNELKSKYSEIMSRLLSKGLLSSGLYGEAASYGDKASGANLAYAIKLYINGIKYMENIEGNFDEALYKLISEKKRHIEALLNSLESISVDVSEERKSFENLKKLNDARRYKNLADELADLEEQLTYKTDAYLGIVEALRQEADAYLDAISILTEQGFILDASYLRDKKTEYERLSSLEPRTHLGELVLSYNRMISDMLSQISSLTPAFVSDNLKIKLLIPKSCDGKAILLMSFKNPLKVYLGPALITKQLPPDIAKLLHLDKITFTVPQLAGGHIYTYEKKLKISCYNNKSRYNLTYYNLQDNGSHAESNYSQNISFSTNISSYLDYINAFDAIHNRIADICDFVDCDELVKSYEETKQSWLKQGSVDLSALRHKLLTTEDLALMKIKNNSIYRHLERLISDYQKAFNSSANDSVMQNYQKHRNFIRDLERMNLSSLIDKYGKEGLIAENYEMQNFVKDVNENIRQARSKAIAYLKQATSALQERPDDSVLLAKVKKAAKLFESGYYTKVANLLRDIDEKPTMPQIKTEYILIPILLVGSAVLILRKPKQKKDEEMKMILRSID